MLKIAKFDSFKLRIPRGLVEIIDQTFAEKYHKIYIETGEVETKLNDEGEKEDVVNLDKHKVNITHGITTRIGIAFFMQGDKQIEQIFIQCNAKQLREDYFLGISKVTVKRLYDYIMDLKIIYIPYAAFLKGQVSDIDICYDTIVSPKDMKMANHNLNLRILPSLKKYVGDPFKLQTNTGLTFNKREKATAAKPFIKIYHKGLELTYNSNIFAEKYLKKEKYQNLGRLEYTIKNKRHKDYLKVEFTTLEELLEIPQTKLLEIILSGIPQYLDKQEIMREYKDLSPTDRMLIYFIERTVNCGADEAAVNRVLELFEKQEKSRMKKKLEQLLNYTDTKDRMFENKGAMNFLRDIGLDF